MEKNKTKRKNLLSSLEAKQILVILFAIVVFWFVFPPFKKNNWYLSED